jgi:hypothetical protein
MDENEQKNRVTLLRCQEWTYGKGKKIYHSGVTQIKGV